MSDDPTHPTLPEHPELAELRGHLRGQWKAQRRTEEREALREHWLQRDLIDAVTEAMHRGDHQGTPEPASRLDVVALAQQNYHANGGAQIQEVEVVTLDVHGH